MRFAYADPPYPGLAHKYPEKTEVDHAALIARLEADYDGWALSTHTLGLRVVVPLLPERARICAWVKPWTSFKPGVRLAWAWEPVIIAPCRQPSRTTRDWVAVRSATQRGLFGAKPEDLAYWIFAAAGLEDGDEVDDLYPGTGVVGRSWERWRAQRPLILGPRPRSSRGARLFPDSEVPKRATT